MNPDTIVNSMVYVGFAAWAILSVAALVAGYLLVYELVKAALQRIFLPLWLYHMVTVLARARAYRPSKGAEPEDCRRLMVRFLWQEIRSIELSRPEMRGLMKELLR